MLGSGKVEIGGRRIEGLEEVTTGESSSWDQVETRRLCLTECLRLKILL